MPRSATFGDPYRYSGKSMILNGIFRLKKCIFAALSVRSLKKPFQIFFSTLLLISISWQCAAKTFIYIDFKRNQEKLAATVCENKDVPGSCCKAKCYLDKEIKKEDKRQADFPSSLKEKTGKTELFSGPFIFTPVPAVAVLNKHLPYFSSLPDPRPVFFFHPPAPVA